MASITRTILSTLLFSVVASAAAVQAPSSSPHAARAGTTRIVMPESWNIYPTQGNISSGPVGGFEVESFDGKSQLEQIVIFRGINPGSGTCRLGWAQSEREDRVFLVDGSYALVKVTRLSGLPAEGEPITADSIAPFETEEGQTKLSPDFTSWDDVPEASDHVAGNIECAEEIYLRLELADPQTPSHVYLKSDEKNGLWLEYSC